MRSLRQRLGSLMVRAQTSAVVLIALLGAGKCSAQTGTFIDRLLPTDLRMVSYNILWDSIFPDVNASKAQKFSRVINALDPDILNLQEIGYWDSPVPPKTGNDVRNLLNTIRPLPGGASWNVYQAFNGDEVIASKYPLTMTRSDTYPAGDRPIAMALVNLPDAIYPTDFYVMNNHYKCCGGTNSEEEDRRIRQSDAHVSWLRDAKTPGGIIDLPPGTPFAVVGDLNTPSNSFYPLNTLVTGNIVNESIFGGDSPPDWDGTNLVDSIPTHNATGSTTYTWRDGSTARFDYVIYSDSALDVGRKFVLNTYAMTSNQRTAAGLQQYDTSQGNSSTYYDHLPVVVDFRLFDFAESDFNYSRTVNSTDLTTWQTNFGLTGNLPRTVGDGDVDGDVDGRDFLTWQRQVTASSGGFMAVPEPGSLFFAFCAATVCFFHRS